MAASTDNVEELVGKEYEHGFVTEIETETAPPGLSEDVVRFISRKNGEPEFQRPHCRESVIRGNLQNDRLSRRIRGRGVAGARG